MREFRGNVGLLAAATLGVAASSTIFFVYSIGVFVPPLTEAFGWSRQQVLGALTAAIVGTMPGALFAGWLADRISNWRLIAVSQLAFGLGCFAIATTSAQLWIFQGLHFIVAVVSSGGLSIVFSRVLAFRFVRNRGLAMGIALAGSGLGGLVLPPYLAFVVEALGWRMGYVAMGLIPLCVAFPATLIFLRDRPGVHDRPGAPAARAMFTPAAPASAPLVGVAFGPALRQWRFWVMVTAFFLANGTAVGIVSNLVPHLTDQGFALQSAAWMVSLFAAASIVGRVVTGALMDRIWGPALAFVVLASAAAGTATLAFVGPHFGVLGFLIVVIGFATGAEVDFLSYFMPKYFGYRSLGKIYACGYVLFNAGAALMPLLFGRIFDREHSYELVFMLGGAAWLAGAFLLLSLGPYPTWPASARPVLTEASASNWSVATTFPPSQRP